LIGHPWNYEVVNTMEESDTLRIVKEDILRILAEQPEKVSSLEFVKSEVRASDSCVSEGLRKLAQEKLIEVEAHSVRLTKEGQDSASSILEKHLTVERYLEKMRSAGEAHKEANVLEHYVSREVIDNIRELSTLEKKGVPLTEFKSNREGIITDITIADSGLFERLISMGIAPGERIKITNRIGHTIIAIVSRTFAFGEDIAEGIQVLEHERT